MTHAGKGKVSTDVTLDQPGDEQSFARIAESEGNRAPDGSVAGEIGDDRCRDDTDGDMQSHIAPKCNQDTRGNTRRGPEYGHAIRLGLQKEAQTSGQKIGDADRDSEPDRRR